MKQQLLGLFSLLFLSLSSLPAQELYPGCDSERYQAEVFTEVQVTADQQFGSGVTIAGNAQDLFLDVYEPVGDEQSMRPVIVMAFGGSFITGQRQDLASLCEFYARQGYVAVTIDYRLYDLPLLPLPTADEMREVVVKSISDYRAAIRFLREDAATDNQFRIDPDQVYIGGVSAGAIAAAHTAVLDETDEIDDFLLGLIEANGGFEGNSSTNTEYSSAVQGYINMSGALSDASWMDENDPPFVSIHDDGDTVVPYDAGFAQVLGFDIVYLEGSLQMQLRADSINVPNQLRTIENSPDHVSYFQPAESFTSTLNFTTAFVKAQICSDVVNVQGISPALEAITVFPNPTADYVQVRNPEGLSLRLRLLDANGRTLYQDTQQQTISVNQLPQGAYWLEVTDMNTAQRVLRQLVVQ
ncbi:MAG: carboxylesterase family protein [Bacteroidota bacterium]